MGSRAPAPGMCGLRLAQSITPGILGRGRCEPGVRSCSFSLFGGKGAVGSTGCLLAAAF